MNDCILTYKQCRIHFIVVSAMFALKHAMIVFQVEWKWANVILIFSGVSALQVVHRRTLASISATLVCSLLAACMGFCAFIIHIVNLVFRRLDVAYYTEKMDRKNTDLATTVSNLNVTLIVIGNLREIISPFSLHPSSPPFQDWWLA